jgi:hypothetical protein
MTEFIKTLLPAIVILSFIFLGLAVTILVRKNGKFPNTHIHGNKYLQNKDIHCVQKEDSLEQSKARKQMNFRNLKYIKK